jgi:hypothetical protein
MACKGAEALIVNDTSKLGDRTNYCAVQSAEPRILQKRQIQIVSQGYK